MTGNSNIFKIAKSLQENSNYMLLALFFEEFVSRQALEGRTSEKNKQESKHTRKKVYILLLAIATLTEMFLHFEF